MLKKIIITAFIQCLFVVPTYGMQQTLPVIKAAVKPRLNQEDYAELARYAYRFLEQNAEKLVCEQNESGFARIRIPVTEKTKDSFKKIAQIRLNCWSPLTGIVIRPESIHTHPNYFESFIIDGGYTHALYKSSPDGILHNAFRILKQRGEKTFLHVGTAPLLRLEDETIQQGQIVTFPNEMIHRVLETAPETLTLNVVFSDKEIDMSEYTVYLTETGTPDDIQTKRLVLQPEQTVTLIARILKGLSYYRSMT